MPRSQQPSTAKTVSRHRLECTLNHLGIPHCRDQDGDVIGLILGDAGAHALYCWFLLQGALLRVLFSNGIKVPSCHFMPVLALCNAAARDTFLETYILSHIAAACAFVAKAWHHSTRWDAGGREPEPGAVLPGASRH